MPVLTPKQEYRRRYYLEHRERELGQARAAYERLRGNEEWHEKRKAYLRSYWKTHYDRERQRARYIKNREHWLQYGRARRKTHSVRRPYKPLTADRKIATHLRTRIWYVVKRSGGLKGDRSMALVGCSIQDLRRYLEARFLQGMTWANYGEWHIDHIRPCASFDLTDPEQQRQCFHYTNLQPLWAVDNLRKGGRRHAT